MLCRHFQKRIGMIGLEYLHLVRINMAKKLLQQSTLYADNICCEAVFSNRKFRKQTGMSLAGRNSLTIKYAIFIINLSGMKGKSA